MSKLIIIASTPYTGSTFLSILLGAHPNVSSISELTGVVPHANINEYVCSCGDRLLNCRFYSKLSDRVRELGGDFNHADFNTRFYEGKNKLVRNLLYRSMFSNPIEQARNCIVNRFPKYKSKVAYWLKQNEIYIQSINELEGTNAFLDASKDLCRIKFLNHLKGVEIYVVHLIRDPRGFANSSRKNKGIGSFRASFKWGFLHREIERVVKVTEVKSIRVRYEDLCRDTLSELNRIYSFCGLSEMSSVEFSPEKMHLIGNRMRLRKNMKIKYDNSWVNELPLKARKLVEFLCRRKMRRYNYK
jgi:hypothetical protein